MKKVNLKMTMLTIITSAICFNVNAQWSGNATSVFLNNGTKNVGIGTFTPVNKLSVNGGADFSGNVGIATPVSGAYLTIANQSQTLSTPPSIQIGFTTSTNLALDHNEISARFDGTASQLYLNPRGGNIGIGTAASSVPYKLTIASGAAGAIALDNGAYLLAKNSAGTYEAFLYPRWTDDKTYLNYASGGFKIRNNSSVITMYMTDDNKVGIGTSSPIHTLDVNGTAGKPGGGSWTAFSDARLKQNVQQYNDGLSQIMRINPVKYHYNETSGYDTKPEYVGVLAQELKEVAPYMVGTFTKEGKEYFDVDNSSMTYMLINAVKEQQKQIEELKFAINSCCENNSGMGSKTPANNLQQSESKLFQNQPNPFNQLTVIRYQLLSSDANAKIIIRNLNGNLVKQISIAQSGKGQVTINANEIAHGTYTYTLEVNGSSADTKLMVVTK